MRGFFKQEDSSYFHLTDDEYLFTKPSFKDALANLESERNRLKKLENDFKSDYKKELRQEKLDRLINN